MVFHTRIVVSSEQSWCVQINVNRESDIELDRNQLNCEYFVGITHCPPSCRSFVVHVVEGHVCYFHGPIKEVQINTLAHDRKIILISYFPCDLDQTITQSPTCGWKAYV